MLLRGKLTGFCQWLKKKSFVICSGIAPVILLSALLLTTEFGCDVIVNGKVIGTAPSREYVYSLINDINEELSPYLGGMKAVTVEPVTTPKIIWGKAFTDTQTLGEKLKSYCPYLEMAYTVKSGNKTVAAFKTAKERKEAYDKFIRNSTKGCESYKILDKVTFEHELVPYGIIKSGDIAYKMLYRSYEFAENVEIEKNSELEDLLTTYCITEEAFRKFNSDYKEGKSNKVFIMSDIPYIRVLSEEEYTENTVIKHSVKFETNESEYRGERKIKTIGVDGFKKTKKTRYSVNGINICEKVTDTQFRDSVTEVVMLGTRENPKGRSSGGFKNPYNGVLTSRFGSRWGRKHNGIDISGPVDSDIKAADGGTVVYAGWDDGGYGNLVKIEHPTGYTTMYAHCNKICVSEGDKVSQGDVVATLGNTGRSTGPHLHFEVIDTDTGERMDPLSFVDLEE